MLACDSETAPVYGEVKATLRSLGKPIPENDPPLDSAFWCFPVHVTIKNSMVERQKEEGVEGCGSNLYVLRRQ